MSDADASHLPPHLALRRERAEEHEPRFLGLTAEEAVARARELDLLIKVIRAAAPISAEFAVARMTVFLGPDGRVARTSVS